MRSKKQEEKEAKSSPKQSDQPSTPAFAPLQLEHYQFSDDLIYIFKKILKYDARSFYQLSTTELKEACQVELRRLQQFKAKDKNAKNRNIDNELSMIVIGNHIRSIIDLRRESEELLRKFGNDNAKKTHINYDQSKDSLINRRYEEIIGGIEKNDCQIRRFMENERANREQIDFAFCCRFFVGQSKKLKRQGQQKIILCQVGLIQTLIFFISEAVRRWEPQRSNQLQTEGEDKILNLTGQDDQNETSAWQDTLSTEQINKYSRYSSRFLEDKMIQLSGICQQIPQLEIFNRTLQFSQLQSREKVSFFRVVDVLISLHHRVSYLSRNKPQLLKELQIAEQQITFINECCLKFTDQIDQQMTEILPLAFEGFDEAKKSQLSEKFIEIKHLLIKLSEIIMTQDQFHTQNFQRVNRLINVANLYSRVVFGDSQATDEWEQLIGTLQQEKQMPTVSDQEYNLIMLLQKCLEQQRNKITGFITQNGDPGSDAKTNEELEDEVNKLIQDYQRLKGQNKVLTDNIDELSRVREDLLLQIQERDNMLRNLSGVKCVLQKKLINQQNASNHSRQKEDTAKKQEYEVQKYLQNSLLLQEQLKISEAQRQRLELMLQTEKQRFLKANESVTKIKPQKERLEIQIEELKERIESMKNDHLRQTNRLSKQINDLGSQKSLFQMELESANTNQLKLIQKLQAAEKKIADYNRKMILKLDEKQDDTLIRMQCDIQKLKRQLELAKSRLAIQEKQCLDVKKDNSDLRIQIRDLRNPKNEDDERDQQIQQMKNKIDKMSSKADNLSKQNNELVQKLQEVESKNKFCVRRIKELQSKERDWDYQKKQLQKDTAQKNRKIEDSLTQIEHIKERMERDLKANREATNRKDQQANDKDTIINHLQHTVRSLEEQLSKKNQQAQQSTQQLIKIKVQHYQTTIQSHKLIEQRLEEQARSLKHNLNQKIEIQIKLNYEVDKLAKEIDRMKDLLDKYMRDITEKQKIIKLQRQKNEEHFRLVRQYEAEDSARKYQQQQNKKKRPTFTPINHQQKPEERTHYERGDSSYTTPGRGFGHKKQIIHHRQGDNDDYSHQYSQISRVDKEVQTSINERSDSPSRTNLKYDHYFDVKEYERLLNEYSDFKASVNIKIDKLQKMVERSQQQKVRMNEKIKIYEQRDVKEARNSDLQQMYVLRKQLADREKDKSDLAKELISSYAEKDALVRDLKDTQNQFHTAQKRNIYLQQQIDKLHLDQRSNDTTSQVQALVRQLKNVKDELNFARHKSQKQKQHLQKLAEASKTAHQQKQYLGRELKNISQQKQSLLRELKRILEEANSFQQICSTLEREKINLQNTIDAYKNFNVQRESISKELTNFKNQLFSTQQRNIALEHQKEILQKQIIELQRHGNPQLAFELQEIRKKWQESQNVNNQLRRRNDDLQRYLQAQTLKMFEHYQREMQRVISERDHINNDLALQIKNLQQQIQTNQSNKQGLTSEDIDKLKSWDEREMQFIELKLQKSTFELDQKQYIQQIQRIGIENQNLRQKNQQIFRQYQNVKLQINKHWDQALKQQISKKEKQWRQKSEDLNNQVVSLIREREIIKGQHDTMRLRYEEQVNRAASLQNQTIILRQELDRSNRLSNVNPQYYLEKIQALEQAVEAIGEQLNDSKTVKNQDQSSSQHNLSIHILPYQQLQVQNDKLKLELQNVMLTQGQWVQKERIYLRQLQAMSRQIITLKQAMYQGRIGQKPKVTTLPLESRPQSSTYNQNNMQEQLKRGLLSQESSSKLLNQITYILEITRRWQNTYFTDTLQRWNVSTVLCQQIQDLRKNLISLCEFTNVLQQQYTRSYSLLMSNPSMENLVEYVVRILSYFSEIELKSPQSAVIRKQLQNMSRTYTGGLFFTVLEEYTIHILDNNTIEEYKRQLRAKAKELLQIKQKLDQLISMKIKQEQQILNRPHKSRRRELHLIPYRESPLINLNNGSNSPQRTK